MADSGVVSVDEMSDLDRAHATLAESEHLERRHQDRRKESNKVPKVPCPKCGNWESSVKDGRAHEAGYRRLRECGSCGERFYTMERAAS